MAERFAYSDERKCDAAAAETNAILFSLVASNTSRHQRVRQDVVVAAIGYGGVVRSGLGGVLAGRDIVPLDEVAAHPLETVEGMSVWVRPVTERDTPMCAALRLAKDLVMRWKTSHPSGLLPVVVNVTDGISTDGDPVQPGRELLGCGTILLNCHSSGEAASPVEFPDHRDALPLDPSAHALYDISSPLPDTSGELLSEIAGTRMYRGARGYVFNVSSSSLHKLFTLFGAIRTR